MPRAASRPGREPGEPRNFLFDLDGCLWFGRRIAPGAPEVISSLRYRGYRVFFLTNASAATAATLADRLTSLGIPAQPDEVVAPLAVVHEHPLMKAGPKVLAVGNPVVARSLAAAGFEVVEDGAAAQVVVVGNSGGLTFAELIPALRALDRGAHLLALNLDLRVPTADGFAPGTGAIVAALEAASGVKAQVVGKPSRFYFEQALRRFGIGADDSVMVGDSPASDVAGGRCAGLRTVLVGDAPVASPEQEPDLRVADLEGVLEHLVERQGSAPWR